VANPTTYPRNPWKSKNQKRPFLATRAGDSHAAAATASAPASSFSPSSAAAAAASASTSDCRRDAADPVLTRRRSDGRTARTGMAVATSGGGAAAAAEAPGVAGVAGVEGGCWSETAEPGVGGGGGVSAAAATVSTARAASRVGAGRRAERGGGLGFEARAGLAPEADLGGLSAGSLSPSACVRLISLCFWQTCRFDRP
jgi:hypothetical protein